MVILGIDPGLATIGWGVLKFDGFRFHPRGYGSINTPAGMDTEERLSLIFDGMQHIRDKNRPDEMAVAEFNPYISQGHRQMMLEVIGFAKKIGAKKLNMHMYDGGKYTMPDKILGFTMLTGRTICGK